MDEEARLQTLREVRLLDTAAERAYDELVELAAAICEVPIALMTLVDRDRQWFKANIGLPQSETSRDIAFCARAIEGSGPFVVPDAAADARFVKNPLVVGEPGIRFYAGVPLVTGDGASLGTLCVIDRRPRALAPAQLRALETLARHATLQIEARRSAAALARSEAARVEADRARREEADLSRLIVEQGGDGIVVADEGGRIRIFNPAAERQHGVEKQAVSAPDWAKTFGLETPDGQPLPLEQTPLYRAMAGERVENARWCVRRPDGSLRLMMGSAWPLTREDGKSRGGVVIIRDITEVARAEEALRESEAKARALYEAERTARAQAEQAMRARDEILAIVSHDLRTPLSAIVVSASVLRQLATDPASREARHAGIILRSSEQMNRLIGDLLEIAAIEAGKLSLRREPVSARALVDEFVAAMAPVADSLGLRLEAAKVEEGPPILLDRERISQVLANLVGNALKFTPPGGVVRIRARETARGLELCVSDTGPGIATEAQPHVFDRFWKGDRASRGGVGLGLSIARGIVEAHGGSIRVESAVGEGTTVSFELPRGAGPAGA